MPDERAPGSTITLLEQKKTPEELCQEANRLLDTYIIPALQEKELEMRILEASINDLIASEPRNLISQGTFNDLAYPVLDDISKHVNKIIQTVVGQIDENSPQNIYLKHKFEEGCAHHAHYELMDQYGTSCDAFFSTSLSAENQSVGIPYFKMEAFNFSAMRFKLEEFTPRRDSAAGAISDSIEPTRGRLKKEEIKNITIQFEPSSVDQLVLINHINYLTYESISTLLINIAHVMPEGGRITVTLRQRNSNAVITIISQVNITPENFNIDEKNKNANKMSFNLIKEYFEDMLGGTFKLINNGIKGAIIEITLPVSK